ncbi:MAG: MazG nucleotide pyrophosphohydrolase domain-containing protein [Elusimicrobiota bacterium]|jgi:XTP/dITP diphosphohydrolase
MKPMDRLIAVVDRLRGPGGCPWDRAQDHRSLIRYLREETRELEHALRRGEWHEIEEELGDVLLQVLLHARIESEKGRFSIQDVARAQALKLVRRHPHVFGGRARVRTAGEVLAIWQDVKTREKTLRRRDVRRRAVRKRTSQ